MNRRDLLKQGSLAALGLLAVPAVHAQGSWPSRTIRMIVPYTPAPRRMPWPGSPR
jgi:tripartite-type tricarboxylate transporter receptor subunit TctC